LIKHSRFTLVCTLTSAACNLATQSASTSSLGEDFEEGIRFNNPGARHSAMQMLAMRVQVIATAHDIPLDGFETLFVIK
jgi:hypothetical protein